MGLNKFYLFFLLLFTCYVSAEEILIKEKNSIYYNENGENFLLFNKKDYCFDKDAFSVEYFGIPLKKYVVVNYTEDCNPSGQYRIFEISSLKAKEFYLSPLYDPEFINNQIIERFKDGAISYKRIYTLKSGSYSRQEEWKSLAPNINISTYFLNGYKVYVLKDDLGREIQNLMITSPKAFLFDRYFIRKKSYLIQGDRVKINHIAKNKDNFFLSIDYNSKKNGVVKAYIMLSDVI